jgi:uncharacterized membrane protein
LLILILAVVVLVPVVQAAPPVVRAILFWDESCPHCHVVMTEVLPPIKEKYGSQFQLLELEISSLRNHDLFMAAIHYFDVPPERQGVPFLVIGDKVLVGEDEIKGQLEAEIQRGLAAGGVDFPAALSITPEDLAGIAPAPPEPVAAIAPEKNLANAIAITVLVGMLVSLGYVAVGTMRALSAPAEAVPSDPPAWQRWAIMVLVVVGLAVSGYLTYVEATQTLAICGPVGNCNLVQASPYAKLAGVPVAVLGLLGYLAIGVLWALAEFGEGRLAELAPLGLLGIATFGTAFSAYLTFLEPFVIKAVCMWCITSAVTITLILLLSFRMVRGWGSWEVVAGVE